MREFGRWRRGLQRSLPLGLVLAGVIACDLVETPPPPAQLVGVRVHSDPGRPLEGAKLLFNGREVGATDADGLGQLKLNGRDGDTFSVQVVCPDGFESPPQPVAVTLRRLADESKFVEYEAMCPPTSRKVVVAIRAENGPDLPVMYLNREVARTDDSGAAHVLLNMKPGDQFDLSLNTGSDAELKPQNPVASFSVGQRDEVFVFDQKFKKPEKPVFSGYVPKPSGPQKIN